MEIFVVKRNDGKYLSIDYNWREACLEGTQKFGYRENAEENVLVGKGDSRVVKWTVVESDEM